MPQPIVERLIADVSPDPAAESELACVRDRAESGDASWAEWLEDISAGRALIARVDLGLQLGIGDAVRHLSIGTARIWIELAAHPPLVECQVQEAAAMSLARAGDLLRELGVTDLSLGQLSAMCIHVRLGPEILDLVRRRSLRSRVG